MFWAIPVYQDLRTSDNRPVQKATGLIHTEAILSRQTEKASFYHPRPRSENLGSEARQVKQSYSSLSGQNGRRVTKALCRFANQVEGTFETLFR